MKRKNENRNLGVEGKNLEFFSGRIRGKCCRGQGKFNKEGEK
jgi:hypothetical protein